MRLAWTAAAAAALMLATAVAAPSVAAFDVIESKGKVGSLKFTDEPGGAGAVCRYENHPGRKNDELDKISVRSVAAGGPFSAASWVGQRMVIQRNTKPYADGKWKNVHVSSIIKRLAPGDSGGDLAVFPARHWKAPEGQRARHRVKLVFFAYDKGSRSKVFGRRGGIVEFYRGQQGTRKLGERGACQALARAHTAT